MKKYKIIFWVTTFIIFVFEGVIPALSFNSNLAIEGVRHLGYPDYFRVMITGFKVLGALALISPFVRGRYKEWAYAGFGLTFISATISHFVIDGFVAMSFFPLVVLAILIVSYISYQKIK